MKEIFNNISEWYNTTIMQNNLDIYVKAGFFVLLFLSIFFFLRSSQTKALLDSFRRKRKKEATGIVKGEHKRFIQDYFGGKIPQILDETYKYSRIYVTSRIKTSMNFFRITMLLAFGLGFTTVYTVGFIAGLIVFILTIILMYSYLEILRIKNNKQVANDMLLFINLLSNYSTGNTEIMSTFMMIAPKMHKCLRGCLIECVAQGQNIGKVEALENLGRKIENRKFREILKALVIAQKYSGGFTGAVNQLRRDMNEHLSSQKQIKSLVATNLISMGVCVTALLAAIYMVGNVIGENSLYIMVTTTIGRICLTVMTISVLWFTKKMLEVEA